MMTTLSRKPMTLHIHVIRERLREQSRELAGQLERSVGRQTSYDALPCTEYRDEVHKQARLMDDILFYQRCRMALEKAIETGGARLTFSDSSGRQRVVRFYMTPNRRVKVYGLSA